MNLFFANIRWLHQSSIDWALVCLIFVNSADFTGNEQQNNGIILQSSFYKIQLLLQ
jgi:hypothetical protein